MKKLIVWVSLFIAGIYFAGNVPLIRHYGINWDEPTHYIRGQAFLYYFMTGKTNYNDLPKLRIHYPKNIFLKPIATDFDDDKFFRRSLYQIDYRGKDEPFSYYMMPEQSEGHPPLNGILASLTNVILYQKLGIVSDIESYHIFILFMSSLLVGGLFWFMSSYYGLFAGTVTTLGLVTYPLFFAESHFNIKDPVETVYYALCALSFFVGVTKNKWTWIFISSVIAGLALGTKFNAIFLFITLFVWLLWWLCPQLMKRSKPFSYKTTIALCFFPIVSFAILYISWPTIWADPIGNLRRTLEYYRVIGFSQSFQPQQYHTFFGFNIYPMELIFFITPLVTLFFGCIGFIYGAINGLRKRSAPTGLIVLLFVVPIVRVMFPKSGIYGGGRQIMEYIPAMAMLSGIGAQALIAWIHTHLDVWRKRLKFHHKVTAQHVMLGLQLLVLASFFPITVKLIQMHPNEDVYFNPLIGGLEGAYERNFPGWGVTLGSAYQQGVDWINAHAEKNANVAIVHGLLSNVPRIMWRGDINFSEYYWSGPAKQGEYLIEVVDYDWEQSVSKEKRDYLAALQPVYEVKVDGVTILAVWKNDAEHLR